MDFLIYSGDQSRRARSIERLLGDCGVFLPGSCFVEISRFLVFMIGSEQFSVPKTIPAELVLPFPLLRVISAVGCSSPDLALLMDIFSPVSFLGLMGLQVTQW